MFAGELGEKHECAPPGGIDAKGCNAESKKISWSILCPYCFGSGCDECKGNEGNYAFYRCVNHCRTESVMSLGFFYRAFRWLEEKSIFPVDGSLLDQSFSFISACDFMKIYAAAYIARKREIDEKFKKLRRKTK